MLDLERAMADVQRKATTARRGVAELHRDGKPMFAPEVHAEHMARLLAPLRQAVGDVESLAQQAEAEAKKLETLASRDPLTSLPTADLERAAALAPFIREEVEAMNPFALAKRLQATLDHGDAVERHLYLRYGGQRTDAIEQAGAALASIRASLTDPKTAQAAQQAAELRTKAATALFDARQMLGEVDGSQQAALERRRQEYAL